jgi:hypothetical protein
MIFISLIIVAILLYIWDYKVPAFLLFFFFITSGFNLIPEELTKFTFFSKGSDYAFFILLGIIVIDAFFAKNYFKPDAFIYRLLPFGLFLVICIYYNKSSVGLGWSEIIRTSRYLFFWAAYLVFRNMERTQLEKLMKYLFIVTVFCSVLYILQIYFDTHILVKTEKSVATLFGNKIPRFYNHPDMLYFFIFMSLYCNPYKGITKIVISIILIVALLGAFHRSLLGAFIIAVSLGYILALPRLKRIQTLSALSVIAVFVIVFAGYKFVHSRTYTDIRTVMSGNVTDMDIDIGDLRESTFSFRIAHLLERNQYILDHPKAMLMGAGLMTEDSKTTGSMFDFDIGLVEELSGSTVQLDTGDISYSFLVLRFGYLGAILNLVLFIYLMVYFYKNRENKYGFFSFLFFVLTFVVSFFASNLSYPMTFLLPLISYNIIKKTKIENEIQNG